MTFEQTGAHIVEDASIEALVAAVCADVERLTNTRCVLSVDGEALPGGWVLDLGAQGRLVLSAPPSNAVEGQVRVAGLVLRGLLSKASEESEQELRAILGGVIDGIITIDLRGTIESFNRAAESMFGYVAEEVIGKNVNVLMEPVHAAAHDGYLERYLATKERRIIGIGREVQAKKKDGTIFWLDLGVTEYFVNGERKFTGILRDLTLRRELEAQVRRSQKLEAVGTLAAGVAHDFNNILMGIRGCLNFAVARLPDESTANVFLDEARRAADRGAKLTRQLLDFSRRTPTAPRLVGLEEIVSGVEGMLKRLVGENVEIVTELGASPDRVLADVGHIEQVVVNLVVNARDAMPDGGCVRITTSNLEDAAGAWVRLTVRDEGEGMDEETVTRIFEPFFTTKPPDRGTGLGLSTVYGIVEEHSGRIAVKSAVGAGTVFEIDFPQRDAN